MLEDCISTPLTTQRMDCFSASMESAVTTQGPRGVKVSKVLPTNHCAPLRLSCQSRAETSWATVNPKMCSAARSLGMWRPAYTKRGVGWTK